MRVFSLTIGYLVKDMLAVVNNRVAGGIPSSYIHWVLTVPAIWTDSAKQFMTEAAIGVRRTPLIEFLALFVNCPVYIIKYI